LKALGCSGFGWGLAGWYVSGENELKGVCPEH